MILEIPVLESPAERINIAQTMTTARLPKPDSACTGETKPVAVSATNTKSAVKSTLIKPVVKSNNAMNIMTAKMRISGGIKALPIERSETV
jgi:hypothetical protein